MPGLARIAATAVTVASIGAFCGLAPQVSGAAPAETIESRRAEQRRDFSDAEILDGFIKLALGAEWHAAGEVNRIRRFDGPVRVFIDNRGQPDRRSETADIIRDIGSRVRHLDIGIVERRTEANLVVTLVRDRDLDRTIRSIFGPKRASEILRDLDPQCLSGFRRDEQFRIQHAEAIVVVDGGDLLFRDCAYEEILQALGPINDDDSIPWTTFNDEVQYGLFTVYDQHVLNLLYHPRMRPGMTRAEVEALVPEILPEVRAFVATGN